MTARIRIAIGGIRYESNSFAGASAAADCFESHAVWRGAEVLDAAEPNSELRGAIDAVAAEPGVELLGVLDTFGGCGAPVPDASYAALSAEFLERLSRLGPVDSVYLPLHGAMTTTERDDVEADLVTRVRQVIGPDVPLVVSFDLHAAVSATTAAAADAVVGFKTCPHTDYVETGQRALTLAIRSARREVLPSVVRVPVPMLTASEGHDTASGPLAGHMDRLQREVMERALLDGSIFACQPWLDTARSTWAVTVTHDASDAQAALALAESVRADLLDDLESFHVVKVAVNDVWPAVEQLDGRPVIVADSGDSPSAGAPGDSVDCLRVLVGAGLPTVLATVTDAPVAAAAHRAGPGATFRVRLGGSLTPGLGAAIDVEATVRSVSDGRFVQEYPASPVDIGPCAVLRVANADIVVTSRPAFMLDTSVIRHAGLDPADYRVVQVKSAGGFRALWSSVSTSAVVVDSLGASSSRLTDLPFSRLPQPLWPFTLAHVHEGAR